MTSTTPRGWAKMRWTAPAELAGHGRRAAGAELSRGIHGPPPPPAPSRPAAQCPMAAPRGARAVPLDLGLAADGPHGGCPRRGRGAPSTRPPCLPVAPCACPRRVHAGRYGACEELQESIGRARRPPHHRDAWAAGSLSGSSAQHRGSPPPTSTSSSPPCVDLLSTAADSSRRTPPVAHPAPGRPRRHPVPPIPGMTASSVAWCGHAGGHARLARRRHGGVAHGAGTVPYLSIE
jgi:putative hemolysin